MKLNKKGGFTLIEIMIVIVIISLLAVTLVPKLTGAQAKSRDTSRASSLIGMKAVLTSYYDDYAEYPTNPHDAVNASGDPIDGDNCLSIDNKGTVDKLSPLYDYVDGGKVSADPQKNALVAKCTKQGSFGYNSLSKNGSDKSAFILSAQTETYQKSNTKYTDSATAPGIKGDVDIEDVIGNGKMFDNTLDIKGLRGLSDSETIYIVYGS